MVSMTTRMSTTHSMTPGRTVAVAALLLYSVHAFASGAPLVGALAIALAVFFARVIVLAEPTATPGSGLSPGAIFLVGLGAVILFGLLLEPLGIWALCAFALPVVVAARWSYGLPGWQAVAVGVGFFVTLVGLLALLLFS
jgi:hypothetical protein